MFNRNTLSVFVCRLSALFRQRHSDRELDEELQTHLTLLAEDFQRRGMTQEEARYAARRTEARAFRGDTALPARSGRVS